MTDAAPADGETVAVLRLSDRPRSPSEHLALDEALLMAAESDEFAESVRLWEFDRPVVVAGRSTRIEQEIDTSFCRTHGIPILRRCSGGASIVAGPGCLMYSLVLRQDRIAVEFADPADLAATASGLVNIDRAHQYVMSRVLAAAQREINQRQGSQGQISDLMLQGTCDLTWKDKKCSGNSLKIARQHLLYHGTILYDFDLSLITAALKTAPRQPEYRRGRDHQSFVTNLPIHPHSFADALAQSFGATAERDTNGLEGRVHTLCQQRYDSQSWHFRH